ncbi:MAG: DUF3300 domain-containing protein [Nitrospirae bacterium]|nr:DUF3300 domain-containing protein [Nitrospirota bacterium]
MGRIFITNLLVVLVVFLSAPLSIQADESAPVPEHTFTDQELDNLMAPIALYPDPLLAQILPASTYPSEVADEAAWLRQGGDISRIDEQNWAESVRAMAHYPDALYMMADNIDWIADIGDAFLNQPEDVTKSIQRLRWRAQNTGNLLNTNQQRVVFDGDDIQIDPAQPQYMYVPVYNPAYVYVQTWTPGMAPFITFGSGLLIGDWLSMDFDWHYHHLIYHGWNRPGWVNNARPYVHITNVYVNRSRPFMNQTWRHDPLRSDPDRFRAVHVTTGPGRNRLPSEVRGRGITTPATPSGGMFGPRGDVRTFSNRGRESTRTSQQGSAPPAAAVSRQPERAAPTFGRGFTQPRPAPEMPRAPSGAFGGYRGAHEAATQSSRGQASRQSGGGGGSQGAHSAPAGRSSAPSGRR